jgi:hypothetical protein
MNQWRERATTVFLIAFILAVIILMTLGAER